LEEYPSSLSGCTPASEIANLEIFYPVAVLHTLLGTNASSKQFQNFYFVVELHVPYDKLSYVPVIDFISAWLESCLDK
jgi:hypothetical protein